VLQRGSVASLVRSENKAEPCATYIGKGSEAQAHHVQLVWATPVTHHHTLTWKNIPTPFPIRIIPRHIFVRYIYMYEVSRT
jgi:hypothetical protein